MEEILEVITGSTGWILGVGLAVGAASALAGGARPLVKKSIKGYLTTADRVRVAAAEAGEHLQDLYAEARMEYDTERVSANGAGPASAESASIIVPGQSSPA